MPDVFPVVKLFTPWGGATWLLSELDPEDEDIAFGLCDLGFGCPELGSVSLSELEAVRGPGGLAIERDLHFRVEGYPWGRGGLSTRCTEARQFFSGLLELRRTAQACLAKAPCADACLMIVHEGAM
jgi:hypothetical protein